MKHSDTLRVVLLVDVDVSDLTGRRQLTFPIWDSKSGPYSQCSNDVVAREFAPLPLVFLCGFGFVAQLFEQLLTYDCDVD